MTVQSTFGIDFACGHSETRNLSDRPAGKRKSFANWLGQQQCTQCWKAENKDDRLEERREAAEVDAKKLGLPTLEGSEKQLEWAPLFRDSIIKKAHEELCRGDDAEMRDSEFEKRILVHARQITRAGWWMDNSDSEPEDLEELVGTALDDDEGARNGTENPY